MRRGLAIELNVAHARDLVHGKPRMFGVSIDNGLAHRWGQLTFILLEDLGRWNWWQQRGHACLIEQIRFEVERTLGGLCWRMKVGIESGSSTRMALPGRGTGQATKVGA